MRTECVCVCVCVHVSVGMRAALCANKVTTAKSKQPCQQPTEKKCGIGFGEDTHSHNTPTHKQGEGETCWVYIGYGSFI